MSKGKKIGYILLSFLPLVAMVLVQYLCSLAIIKAVSAYYTAKTGEDSMLSMERAYSFYMDNSVSVLVLVQLIVLLIFGTWYYLAFGRKKTGGSLRDVFRPGSLGGIALLAIGMYFLITLFMAAAQWLAPGIMADYNMIIEESGIAGLTLMSTIASLVLAPLGEELIFRGLTFRYLKKAGACFWAANTVQAVLFGAAHFNWIQGIYAFILGVVLGCLYRRFKSLLAPMLFHMFFNFLGTYLAAFIDSEGSLWFYLLFFVLGALSVLLGLRAMRLSKTEP